MFLEIDIKDKNSHLLSVITRLKIKFIF